MARRLLALALLAALLAPAGAGAEFYSYEDQDGTIHFVEDPGKVPAEYRRKKRVHKDKYDELPEEERSLMLEKERQEREEARRKDEEQEKKARQARSLEEKKAALERLRNLLTTPVTISGRQVFVRVKLTNGSAQTDALLLLDTGATTTVITPEVAARLKIEETDNVRVGVVGGRVLKARRAVLSQMEVGPVKRTDQEVIVVGQRGGTMGDGLLGMSFLAGLKYTIDFQKQTINWIP